MAHVYVLGSLNIDDVFMVPHIAKSGETISSTSYTQVAGGKGANQSVAISRAGGIVHHVGCVGKDGQWLVDLLRNHGVDTELVQVMDQVPTGRAIIQVSESTGDNAIVLLPGANHAIKVDHINTLISHHQRILSTSTASAPQNFLLLQNETTCVFEAIELGKSNGFVVILNPAPCPPDLASRYPLEKVDMLILNEHEAESLIASLTLGSKSILASPEQAVEFLLNYYRSKCVVITLGERGAAAGIRLTAADDGGEQVSTITSYVMDALSGVNVVDTTAAGDTFVGFLVARIIQNQGLESTDGFKVALKQAITASGLACETKGAIPSIPSLDQVKQRMVE
ncbi:hypothetical protein HDV05_006767 [Chytridiales sp. JEL 0842]|nr:hypothetical protein HDV05_006767 [Chytridiales sp. JEL 0842]